MCEHYGVMYELRASGEFDYDNSLTRDENYQVLLDRVASPVTTSDYSLKSAWDLRLAELGDKQATAVYAEMANAGMTVPVPTWERPAPLGSPCGSGESVADWIKAAGLRRWDMSQEWHFEKYARAIAAAADCDLRIEWSLKDWAQGAIDAGQGYKILTQHLPISGREDEGGRIRQDAFERYWAVLDTSKRVLVTIEGGTVLILCDSFKAAFGAGDFERWIPAVFGAPK